MKRIYSTRDFEYYTLLRQVLCDLELIDKHYLWLISDIEAYPTKEEYQDLVQKDYLLMTTSELVEMLEHDDFQWVWAVFSAISPGYTSEEILQFNLPYVQDVEYKSHNPHKGTPRLQHPYAEFEIYAVDSSYMFMVSNNEVLINQFKESYPLSKEE